MNTDTLDQIDTKIHTSTEGLAVIEQPESASVVLSADQILTVIEQLHACYDYCAAWKEPMQQQDRATSETQP